MLDTVYSCAMFVVGACFASFGNCITYRIPRQLNWTTAHSICTSCGKRLSFLELVPVLSCFVLGARCSKCHAYFGEENGMLEFFLGMICYAAFIQSNNTALGFIWSALSCVIYVLLALTCDGITSKVQNL